MKFLLIGDPHFTNGNKDETDILSESTINVIKEKAPDFVVLLGDIMDKFETSHVIPWTRAINYIEEIAKLVPVVVLIGNHDLRSNKDNQTGINFFTALKGKNNIYIVDMIQEICINGFFFLASPFVPLNTFISSLSDYFNVKSSKLSSVLNKYKAVFAHQELRGCVYNSKISTSIDKWSSSYPPLYSGHIHDYKIVTENLIYVGTPFQHKFDESPDKALMLVTEEVSNDEDGDKDINDNTKKAKPEIKVTRQRIPIDIEPLVTMRLTINDYNKKKKKLKGSKRLKLIIEGERDEVNEIMKHKDIRKLKEAGTKIIPSYNIIKRVIDRKNRNKPYLGIVHDEILKDDDSEELLLIHERLTELL